MADRENVWETEVWEDGQLQTIPMQPGCVYCSAPFIFEHGVKYSSCSRDDPVIALQCRFAFPNKIEAEQVNSLRNSDMLLVTNSIANCLRRFCDNGQFRLPSLHE